MSSTHHPSTQMHEDEVLVDDALVRALLKDQFPDVAERRLMRSKVSLGSVTVMSRGPRAVPHQFDHWAIT